MRRALVTTMLSLAMFDCLSQVGKGIDKKAIICLTYDDALESHVKVAIPQLDSLGLKATFFLNSIKGSTEVAGLGEPTILLWKKAAQSGHELGNHTLFHPCPEKFGWQKELAIEGYTLESLMKEIELTNLFLKSLDGQSKERVFAYPCNNTIVQGIDYSMKLKETKLVKYARTGGDKTSIIKDFKLVDPMKIPSWFVAEGTTLNELIAFAKEVKEKGKMGVYQFHGIGSPLFRLSPGVHKQFLEYLNAHKEDYWVTTISEAMDVVTRND